MSKLCKLLDKDDGSSAGTNIPRLAINRTPEDDDGNQLPVVTSTLMTQQLVKMCMLNQQH